MACQHNSKINCNCTYNCSKHSKCCECIAYHNASNEFPACLFSAAAEAKYDRSMAALIKDRQNAPV